MIAGIVVLFSFGRTAVAQAPVWNPSKDQTSPKKQFQSKPNWKSFSGETLSQQELAQTIRALELIEVLGHTDLNNNLNQISTIKTQLKKIPKEQSSPYQLSSSQTQQLKAIFSSLREPKLTAINQLLLIEKTDNSLTLTQQQIGSLRQVLGSIPSENLSNLQEKQLTVVQNFLRNTPQQQSVSLSFQQTDALSRAIAFVFFTFQAKTGQTAQISQLKNSDQVTLTQKELDEIIQGLQAIQQGQFRPNQTEEINNLLRELQQQKSRDQTVTFSSQKTEQLRRLIGSLTPNETAAMEILLLSEEPPENVNLTQQQINSFINFFQGLPTQQFTASQRQQQQQLINFLTQLQTQGQSQIELSSAETQSFLHRIQLLIFDQSVVTAVSLEQLQNLVRYLETARDELSLSQSESQSIGRLRQQLTSLDADLDEQFVIPPRQNQQLKTFVSSLSRGQRQDIQKVLIEDTEKETVSSPAITYYNPIGYGNSWGNIEVGLIYDNPNRFGDSEDGSVSLSAGFGNPNESVGLETNLTFYSLTDQNQSDAFSTGSLSFKASRNLPGKTGVSFGVENLIRFSPDNITPPQSNVYVVGSKRFQLREDPLSPFGVAYITTGIGNGRFSPVNDFEFEEDGSFNLFGSLAVQILPRVNAITEWTGQDVNLGLSAVPFRELPLVITLMAVDISGNVEEEFGQDGRARFSGSINFGFSF